jgi:hypothetical protein
VALAQRIGTPQRHLSEMENGKWAVGRKRARVLPEALLIDYQLLP